MLSLLLADNSQVLDNWSHSCMIGWVSLMTITQTYKTLTYCCRFCECRKFTILYLMNNIKTEYWVLKVSYRQVNDVYTLVHCFQNNANKWMMFTLLYSDFRTMLFHNSWLPSRWLLSSLFNSLTKLYVIQKRFCTARHSRPVCYRCRFWKVILYKPDNLFLEKSVFLY